MAGQTIQVSVLADTRGFSRAMAALGNDPGFRAVGTAAANLGKAIAVGVAGAAAGVGAVALSGVQAAAQLQQSVGAIDSVFKGNAGQMHAWANTAATDVGLTANEFNELGTLIGSQLKNGGTAMEELAPKTKSLIGLGADLSSMYGGTTKDAVEALSSALKGERDPIERYGVSLNQSKIDAEAAALGYSKVGNSFSNQAQQAATLSLIMKQTADAHGNFAKESNTLAHQQEVLRAKWGDIQAQLGTYLLPILTAVAMVVSDNMGPAFAFLQGVIQTQLMPAFTGLGDWFTTNGLPAFQALGDWFTTTGVPKLQEFGTFITTTVVPGLQGVAQWAGQNADVLTSLGVAIAAGVAAYRIWTGAIAAWKAIQLAATAVQAAFNLVLAANPIMLVVIAIAALVAGLVYFFTQTTTGKEIWADFTKFLTSSWDGFTKFIGKAWADIKKAFDDGVKQASKFMDDCNKNVTKAWDGILKFFGEIPGKTKAVFNGAGEWLKSAGDNIMKGLKSGAEIAWATVIGWITGLQEKVTGVFNGAGDWLKNAGGQLLNGLWSGISDKVGWLKSQVEGVGRNVIDAVKAQFGIHSPSRVFASIGDYLVQGLAVGLSNTSAVDSAMNTLSGAVTAGLRPDLRMTASTPAGGNTFYSFDGLTFTTATDEEASVLAEFITMARRKIRAAGGTNAV